MNLCSLSAIAALLFVSGPSAIDRLIISIHFNTVKSCPCRTRTHIHQKNLEIVPPFTKCYSSTAVIFKSVMVRVIAPIASMSPASILGRSLVSRSAVNAMISQITFASLCLSCHMGALNTSAANYTSGFGLSQIISHNELFSATITETAPSWATFSNSRGAV